MTRAARVLPDLLAGLVLLAAVASATCRLLGLGTSHLALSVAIYAVAAAILLLRFPPALPGRGMGAANRVTLARAALVVPVGALAIQPGAFGDRAAWWVIGLATLGMILDGVDGRVARRSGGASAFGARFDMELDAALLMALAALLWRTGLVGAWVLAIGALRYLFVLAGAVLPALRGDLPPSLRRKVVCVIQGIALVVALGPIIPPSLAVAGLAFALGALLYSFGVDVLWLLRAPAATAASRSGGAA